MTTSSPRTLDYGRLPPLPIRKFSVDEYHRLGEVGVLTTDDRVELLEGWILQKMTHNPPHGASVDHLRDVLADLLPDGWRVRAQLPVTTADSEPEPDLVVVRGPASRYVSRHPSAEDAALIVEIADTSLERDREVKGPIYSRAGFPVYWIVNLVERRVEVYSDPSPTGGYHSRRDGSIGDHVSLRVGDEEPREIAVKMVFVA